MTGYAVGFLRRDVSGPMRRRHEDAIHAAATRHGYTICLMVLAAPEREAVVQRLMTLIWNEAVDAIVAPSADHFEHGDIEALIKFADVICADSGARYAIPAADMGADGDVKTLAIAEEARWWTC
ncbi:hypothetical protein [Nocardia sp. NBC_00511]|uniref:hypothetical protein n=1 Tax=Nocardia sp. NBC_00511 TaxID=2903591 RepID=UPI0030E5BC44